MTKKAINGAAIRQAIMDSRANGKSDQEIYNEQTQLYYDKSIVAGTITATPTVADIERYKKYNNLLLGILAITIVFKILTVLSLALVTEQPLMLLFIFVVPLLTVYFMYEIRRYNAPTYRILGMLAIAGFLESISKSSGIDIVINLVLAGSVSFLAFYLDKHLFPNYSPRNMKKDENGEFIL